MLFALIFCQSLNRLQRGLSAIAELLVLFILAWALQQRSATALPVIYFAQNNINKIITGMSI